MASDLFCALGKWMVGRSILRRALTKQCWSSVNALACRRPRCAILLLSVRREFSLKQLTSLRELRDALPPFDKARLLSVSGQGAGASSLTLGYVFTPREFTVLIKWWCGLEVFDSKFACPGCGAAMDLVGYHALTCRHLGSFGIRHNALREIFLRFLSSAGIPAEREAPSLLPGTAARPAGIFVPNYEPSQPACLDFAVTHPATEYPSTC